MLARAIYDADQEDRGKREWARLLGICKSSVRRTLNRAGIECTADTVRVEVDSQRDAKDQARERGAKILGIEADGHYKPYEAAMDIPQDSVAILQPPARHEIVSDEKQIIKAPPAKPRVLPPGETTTVRADNMGTTRQLAQTQLGPTVYLLGAGQSLLPLAWIQSERRYRALQSADGGGLAEPHFA